MKNFLLITCLLSISFIACSNDIATKNVPSVVLNAFKTQFPTAVDVEWEKVNNLYEVDFEIANVDHTARLNTEGKLLQLKKEISAAELPKAISDAIATNFKDYGADDLEVIKKGNQTYYQLQLEKNWSFDKKLVFNANGQVNKSVKYWD